MRRTYQVEFAHKRAVVIVARTPKGAQRVAEKRYWKEGKAVRVMEVGE